MTLKFALTVLLPIWALALNVLTAIYLAATYEND